jgi:Mg2+ and Co2+ transporter CorA
VLLLVGRDFLLTVHHAVPLLGPLRAVKQELRQDQVLYRLADTFVESYIPLADQLERGIERLEDEVLGTLGPPCWRKLGRPLAISFS